MAAPLYLRILVQIVDGVVVRVETASVTVVQAAVYYDAGIVQCPFLVIPLIHLNLSFRIQRKFKCS